MAPVETDKFIDGKWYSMPVNYNTRDLLLYAVGIGCSEMKFIYEDDDDFSVFPTYPVLLNMKGESQNVDTPASAARYLQRTPGLFGGGSRGARMPIPSLDGVRVGVDAERYIEKVKELPTEGGQFELRQRLYGIHKKGSGALLEIESELVGSDGTVHYRFVGGGFQIGATNFKDGGQTNSRAIKTPDRTPDRIVELRTSPHQAQIYRLSGDYNPLHVDAESPMVTKGGFKGPILHGLCTLGHAARAVLGAFADNDASRFHSMKVRFASPVYPGDTLVTKCWSEADDRVIFVTEVKETGKVVIANAYMQLTPRSRL